MEKKNLDWANLGFGYMKADKRFVSNFKNGAWDEGVLTDDDTASSAEYCASALRDSAGALLIGEKTFGKGIMQTTFPLGDGSAIKLTVAKMYTKSGYEFHLNGLTPDIEASYTEEQAKTWFLLTDGQDPYITAALESLKK